MSKKVFDFGVGSTKENVIGSFEIRGQEFEVRELLDSSIAYLISAVSDASDPMRTVGRVLDFAHRALTKESAARFEKLVLGDHETPGLKIEQVVEVFQWILPVVAAGPTQEEPKTKAPRRAAAVTSQ